MMKFNKNNGEELNSGILYFGTKTTKRDEKRGVANDEFIEKGKLKYKLKSYNHEDFTNYFGIEKKVDIKVKVYRVKDLEETLLIRIGNVYYEIVKMDGMENSKFVFLYLQKRS